VQLSESEIIRYDRQIILSGWGREGQEKVKESSIFIAGAGGLGSSVALYLAAAGVGCLRICDYGKVELSNLNRQILHLDDSIGKKKVDSAENTLVRINPHVKIVKLFEKIKHSNVSSLIGDAQIIIDCLDNFPTRYILNEHAVKVRMPMIHAGIYGLTGQITFLQQPQTPCLACIFPSAPPAEVFPVVGTAPGIIGCLEAQEALKYLLNNESLLKNRLLIWDGENSIFEQVRVEKNPFCRVCSKG
jgi:adenylyltransferase/sulfurtransferase